MHRRRRGLALAVLVVPVAIAALALAPADDEPSETPAATTAEAAATTAATQEATTAPLRFPEPDQVRGVHIDYATAADPQAMAQIFGAADLEGGLNAIQLDVKDERGRVGIDADVPLAERIGAVDPAYDAEELVARAHEAGLYTIARVVAFQDPVLAAKGGAIALERKGGGIWATDQGLGWIDPTDRRAWNYVIGIALAAADAGFDEVMFDYVRFPSDGDTGSAVYVRPQASKVKTINGFLQKAGTALRGEGVRISAAIFGIAASSQESGAGIGQDPTELKKLLDTIAPMVYPSHYGDGTFNIPHPAAQPQDLVSASLLDWRRHLVNGRARLRPWLQDFDYNGYPYSTDQVLAQIRAAQDMGTAGYLLWNTTAEYSPGVLTP